MRTTLLIMGLLASPAAAQVAPSALTGPPSLSPWTGPIAPPRTSRPKITVHDAAFQREAAALQADMKQARSGDRKLSAGERTVFERRYAALLQRYGYAVPRFK